MTTVLFLTSHLPFPPYSGGRRREYELLCRLGKVYDIEVYAVTRTLAEDLKYVEVVRSFVKGVSLFPARSVVSMDRGLGHISPLAHRNASRSAAGAIARRIEQGGVDLLHCEGYYMHSVVGKFDVPIFTMEQNIEYLVWPEAAERIRTEEIHAWRSSTSCGAVTDEDAMVIRQAINRRNIRVSFDGCDHSTLLCVKESLRPEIPPKGPLVLCPGNFAYRPSYEAGLEVCSGIGPEILRRYPEAVIMLVGNDSERLLPFVSHPKITLLGRVSSLESFYAAATVVICPLRLGRGIKVKVLEALVRGCALVTTTVGVQGLRDAPVVVSDSPDQFVAEVVRLLLDRDARNKLKRRAAAYGAALPTWNAAAERLHECWEEAIRLGEQQGLSRLRGAVGGAE